MYIICNLSYKMKDVTPEELIRMVSNSAKANMPKVNPNSTKIKKTKGDPKKEPKSATKTNGDCASDSDNDE